MDKAEKIQSFIRNYHEYIESTLKPEHRKITTLLERWKKPDYWANYAKGRGSALPSPIKSIFTRIKRPERVIDKILQKPQQYPEGLVDNSFIQMHDCIGVRIIVYFLGQLPYIDRELRNSKIIDISEERPPEAYLSKDLMNRYGLTNFVHREKESGYESIHYVVRLKERNPKKENRRPWFEMQVRTLAQELWSEMEHILAYKAQKQTNLSAKRRFQILSKEINAIDEHFNLLHEELMRNQESTRHDEEEDLSTENLPYTFSLINVRCAQQDFDSILNILRSRGVTTIKEFVSLATAKRMQTINNTYASVMGRPPTSFELIASLGALKVAEGQDEDHHHVTSQIEISKYWNKFRKQIMAKNKDAPRFYKP